MNSWKDEMYTEFSKFENEVQALKSKVDNLPTNIVHSDIHISTQNSAHSI